jgi:hypothetical protein
VSLLPVCSCVTNVSSQVQEEGQLYTHMPSDVFNMLNVQMEVAKARLQVRIKSLPMCTYHTTRYTHTLYTMQGESFTRTVMVCADLLVDIQQHQVLYSLY